MQRALPMFISLVPALASVLLFIGTLRLRPGAKAAPSPPLGAFAPLGS